MADQTIVPVSLSLTPSASDEFVINYLPFAICQFDEGVEPLRGRFAGSSFGFGFYPSAAFNDK